MQLSFNSDIFFDFIGRLKLATVVLGFIDLILIASSYVSSDSRDNAFLAIVIICFVLSLLWVLGVMFGVIVIQDNHIKYDMIYHIVACFLLVVTGIFFMVSIIRYGSKIHKFSVRLVSLIFGLGNAAIYGYLPWKLLKAS